MPTPSLLAAGQQVHDLELLRLLRGRRLCRELQVLCVVGAHRLDELPLIDRLFPRLRRIYVFEPLPEPLRVLRQRAAADPRIEVFALAVSDRDGSADFHITSNDGESSSLLPLGSHRDLFPQVQVSSTIRVPTRRLDTLLAERGLEPPDVAIIDVQGAEHQVLMAFGDELRQRLRLIYTEVSTEQVYAGAALLSDIEALLRPRFVNVGFASINPDVPTHGNAVFVAAADADSLMNYTLDGRVRLALRSWRKRRRERRPAAQ